MATRRNTELGFRAPGLAETERRVERFGETGERAMRRVRRGSGEASAGLKAVSVASREAGGVVEDLAARAGPAGRVLAALGPAGLVAAAGIGAATLAITASVAAGGRFESQMLTVEAVLRATGVASGFTSERINRLSQDIGLATLANTGQVREAAAQLLTFRSISGETFQRALRDAQDLAAVGFGSLSSASVQLGKALEDPIQGVSALKEVGVSFTEAQRDLIKTLVETGSVAEAQSIILDVLEQQVGGAAVAQAGGLAGATDSLSENWTRMLENIGNAGPVEAATGALGRLATVLSNINDLAEETAIDRLQRLEGENEALSGPFSQDSLRAVLRQGFFLSPRIFGRESDLAGPRMEAGFMSDLEGMAEAQARATAEAEQHALELARMNAAVDDLAERADPAIKQTEELTSARNTLTAAVEKGVITAERAAEIEAQLTAQLDGSARASARLAQQRDRAIGGLQLEVERLGALVVAHRQGAAAIAATEAETQALTLARRLALEEGDQELDQIRELIGERSRLNAEIEAAAEAEQRRQAALEEARKDTERVLEDIVDAGRDAFVGLFEDMRFDWGDLWDDLSSIALRALGGLAAQAAGMVIAPVVAPVLNAVGLGGTGGLGGGGGLFGGGLGSPLSLAGVAGAPNAFLSGTLGGFGGLNQFGFNNLGTGLPGLPGGVSGATLSSILGAAGIGAFGGGLLAGLTGGNRLGGSVGGGFGAGLGFAIGGPVGGLIGGVGGSLLGGLFGGGSSTEANEFTVDLSTGAIRKSKSEVRSDTGRRNTEAARALAESFSQQIVPSLLASLGAELSGPTALRFQVATNGIRVGDRSSNSFFGPGQTDAALLNATQRLIPTLEGVSAELQAVVSASGASTAQGLLSDLEFAKAILGEGEPETLQGALAAIGAELDAMRERALGLGLSLEDVTAAVDKTRDALLSDLLGGLEAFQQSLAISDLAPVSPTERFATAQGQFGDLRDRALGGDLEAIGAFPAAAQEFLGIARDTFASGPEFARLFRDVNRTLGAILDIPAFAGGTESAPRGLALLGERGPELVEFRGGERVLSAEATRTAFASGGLAGAFDRQGGQASNERQAMIDLLDLVVKRLAGVETALRELLADQVRMAAA